VRANDYDLIISDIDMPRLNGFELISLIKNDPNLQNLPVIIVSYKDRLEEKNKGLEIGADYYITKGSFQDQTLVNAVRDLIGDAEE
jgi:two-component system sensor histidine kinase and response regulator WspE